MDDRMPAISFSEETIALYEEIEEEDDPAAKEGLLIDLAVQISHDVERLDTKTPDTVHELVNDLDQAQLAFDQAAHRLLRATLDQVKAQAQSKKKVPEKPASQPNLKGPGSN